MNLKTPGFRGWIQPARGGTTLMLPLKKEKTGVSEGAFNLRGKQMEQTQRKLGGGGDKRQKSGQGRWPSS